MPLGWSKPEGGREEGREGSRASVFLLIHPDDLAIQELQDGAITITHCVIIVYLASISIPHGP